jgi:hypothetical protein
LRKRWRRAIEEEGDKMGKTWRDVKAIAGNRVCRLSFVDALRSEVE